MKIQTNTHCSTEDAIAAMKLVQLKLSKNIFFGDQVLKVTNNSIPSKFGKKSSKFSYSINLSTYLLKSVRKTAVIGDADILSKFQLRDHLHGFQVNVNRDVKNQTCRALNEDYETILSVFSIQNDSQEKYLRKFNKYLLEITDQLRTDKSICIVIIGEKIDSLNGSCFIRLYQDL